MDVLLGGAGMVGLGCARRLHQEGISFQIFEALDGVGDREHPDKFEGFPLDRSFQVLQTACPKARRFRD